jgi:hypothetical protein
MRGVFAEAKQFHGLSRARYPGRSEMQIQAYQGAVVQNLKRLLFPVYSWLAAYWHRSAADRAIVPTGCKAIVRMTLGRIANNCDDAESSLFWRAQYGFPLRSIGESR